MLSETSVLFRAGLRGSDCIECLEVKIYNDDVCEGDKQMFTLSFANNSLNIDIIDSSTATVYIKEVNGT